MVLDATQPATADERDFFVDVIAPFGHDDIFWVFNKINNVEPRQRAAVEAHARNVLSAYIKYDHRIFFVDAKGALDARVEGDEDALLDSNLPLVERNLQGFLARQRGRSKVMVPTHQLQRSVRDVGAAVAGERELLDATVDDLREAYLRNQAPLDRLRGRVGLISRNLDHELDRTLKSVAALAEEFLSELTARIPTLMSEAELSRPDDFINPVKVTKEAKLIQRDLSNGVTTALTNECTKWVSTTLVKHVTGELQKVQKDLREDVADFEQELHEIRVDLSPVGKSLPKLPADARSESTGMLRPLPSAQFVGYQFAMGAVGGAVLGGMGAFGMGILTAVLGLGGGIILPAALIAVAVGMAAGVAPQRKELGNWLRPRLAKAIAEQWTAQAERIQKQVVVDTKKLLDQLRAEFKSDLTGQVALVEEQATAALAEMNRGQDEVDARKRQLDLLATELDEIERDVDRLIDHVDQLDSGVPAMSGA